MDATVVLSLVLSAVVAAVVTMLIEYAAKPRLEARKEQILRQRRAMWDLRDALVLLDVRVDSARSSLREEEVELATIEAAIDDAFAELRRVESLATVVSGALPPAIWAELSFGFGRHAAMADMATLARSRVPAYRRIDAYRDALRSLGANISLPMEYLTTKSRRRRRAVLQEAIRREEEREREMPDEEYEDEEEGPDDLLWRRLKELRGDSSAADTRPADE